MEKRLDRIFMCRYKSMNSIPFKWIMQSILILMPENKKIDVYYDEKTNSTILMEKLCVDLRFLRENDAKRLFGMAEMAKKKLTKTTA